MMTSSNEARNATDPAVPIDGMQVKSHSCRRLTAVNRFGLHINTAITWAMRGKFDLGVYANLWKVELHAKTKKSSSQQYSGFVPLRKKDLRLLLIHGEITTDRLKSPPGCVTKIVSRGDAEQPYSYNQGVVSPEIRISKKNILITREGYNILRDEALKQQNTQNPMSESKEEGYQKTIGALTLALAREGEDYGGLEKPKFDPMITSTHQALSKLALTQEGLSKNALGEKMKEGVKVLKDKNKFG